MIHWSWGLSTALLLTLSIYLSGCGVRMGWLLGATIQVINMSFGLAYGQWTFAFLALPAGMFVFIYFRHPLYVKPRGLILPVQKETRVEWPRTCESRSPEGGERCDRPDYSHAREPDRHWVWLDLEPDREPRVVQWGSGEQNVDA